MEAIIPRERPGAIHGLTERIRTGHGNMYVTINFDEQDHPFEMFTTLGKAGGCDSAQLEAISRLVSLLLRCGVSAGYIIDQLGGITCCPAWDNGVLVRSAPDAIALAFVRQEERSRSVPRRLPPAPGIPVQWMLICGVCGSAMNINGIYPICPVCKK